jgi:shikimate kinase
LRVPWAGTTYRREPKDRVVVNATPLGSDGPVAAFASAPLEGLWVLDAPYAPAGRACALAALAREAGAARVVDGLDLLVLQAQGQARAFLGGVEAPPDVLRMAVRPRTNLVLVGLRGAGKTEVGRRVARLLGRPFVDTDQEVERRTGRTAAEWIRRDGWERFREVEARAVDGLRGRRGLVVATGGGTLETPACRAALAEAAVGVWLDAPPDLAAARVCESGGDRDRPSVVPGLDPEGEARELLRRRQPLWIDFARDVVPATDSVEEVASRVARVWIRRAGSDAVSDPARAW